MPDWVKEKLGELPATMRESGQRAGRYESALLNLVEAHVLRPHVGEEFDAVVVAVQGDDPRKGDVVLQDPAVEAPVTAEEDLPLGTDVRVRLTVADPEKRQVRFELA